MKMLFTICIAVVLALSVSISPVSANSLQAKLVKLTASDGTTMDLFGGSVSIDGNTALVGAFGDDSFKGSAYVFVRKGKTWIQQAKLTASDGAAGDNFGCSLSIDGNTALVGANGDDDHTGSVYVFVRTGTTWTQQAKLTASDATAGDQFGNGVSIHGNTALVGASMDSDNGDMSGSAYVFVRKGKTWIQQAKLTAYDGAEFDFFGYSVSIHGNTTLVGAIGDDADGDMSGSVYVFVRRGKTWTEQAKLTDGTAGDTFGHSVSIHGNTALVGASGHFLVPGSIIGSAYVFVRRGATWTQEAKLTASDGAADDYFGFSVSIHGKTALVGSYGIDSGSAYVFVRRGKGWTEQAKLTASDGIAGETFGYSVSIHGNTALVGASGDDDYTGSAYVFMHKGRTSSH